MLGKTGCSRLRGPCRNQLRRGGVQLCMPAPTHELASAAADIERLAAELLRLLESGRLKLAVAESCTAGLLARHIADAPGASAWFNGGFVTYTKDSKARVLAVAPALLRDKGAVCREVAQAMARGALRLAHADLAVAVTGVAGPEPDEDGNPVGRVCIAVAHRGGASDAIERRYPDNGRDGIRHCAIADALKAAAAAARTIPDCRL